MPIDLSLLPAREQLADIVGQQLENGIDCVFFEAGSNSLKPADYTAVVQTRCLIDTLSPDTLFIVSGGIRTPEQARLFAGITDYINIGGHFERNGTQDTADFVRAIS